MAPPNASNINIIQYGIILNDIFWNSVTEKTFNTRRQGSHCHIKTLDYCLDFQQTLLFGTECPFT